MDEIHSRLRTDGRSEGRSQDVPRRTSYAHSAGLDLLDPIRFDEGGRQVAVAELVDQPGLPHERRRQDIRRGPERAGRIPQSGAFLLQPADPRLPARRRARVRFVAHPFLGDGQSKGGQGDGGHGHAHRLRDDELRARDAFDEIGGFPAFARSHRSVHLLPELGPLEKGEQR